MVSESNSLEQHHPNIAKEWHPTKNVGLTPRDIARASGKKVWWRCSYNPTHEWQAKVKYRTILNSGCPLCEEENRIRRAHEALLQSAQANAEFFITFKKAIESIKKLSQQQLSKHLRVQQPLFRMLYSSTITAMETYLCDAFFHKVTSCEALTDKLLLSVHDFKEKKYSISDILDWKNNTIKKLQSYLLEDIVWHNIPKVQFLYKSALEIEFPANIDFIHKSVAIRHDLVHRNGRSITGKFHILTKSDIELLVSNVEEFIEYIENEIKSKQC
jgi:hypothetical protein